MAKKAAAKKAPAKKRAGIFKVKGDEDVTTIQRHFRAGRTYKLDYDEAAEFVEAGQLVEVKK
tara:strand:+ start:1286 stop:1471 length:186 start_codon:yes stop_codon:yes gene_type:complete